MPFTSPTVERASSERDVWVETESHPRVPHPRHARVKHARFTHVLTDVPARIRHRTTRVSAPLYGLATASMDRALHIHTRARRATRCSTSPFGRCRRTGVHNFSSLELGVNRFRGAGDARLLATRKLRGVSIKSMDGLAARLRWEPKRTAPITLPSRQSSGR